MNYAEEIHRAMMMLAGHPQTIFLGQAVSCPGTSMSGTLEGIPKDKLIEMPVTEDMQLGVCIGMSLSGFIPVAIYPRWNFLLLATNQLVNHLDKLPIISNGGYCPKVIIRVGVGSERPLHPQHQHIGDFTEAFRRMCWNIDIIELDSSKFIFPSYEQALKKERKSTLLVEYSDYYDRDQ